MSEARYLVGDVFDRLAELTDGSIDLVVTSPPFFTLRSYVPDDHELKHREIGAEGSPGEFLSTLLELTGEFRRVLAPHGSIAVELGDTYAGSGGAGGDYAKGGMREGQPAFKGSASKAKQTSAKYNGGAIRSRQDDEASGVTQRRLRTHRHLPGYPLEKSLCLIPTLYAASLAYGRNLLLPDVAVDSWRVRNLIVWHRTNPTPGDLADKVRPSTSYITTACVSRRRWFDIESERATNPGANTHARTAKGIASRPNSGKAANDERRGGNFSALDVIHRSEGAPPLDCWFDDDLEPDTAGHDVWTIATTPYKGSHYATFPLGLPRRLINLMCPMQVCTTCGEPRRRITQRTPEYAAARAAAGDMNRHLTGSNDPATGNNGNSRSKQLGTMTSAQNVTVGWTDCGHATWRRGVVLDPFAGSGTTLQAAAELGRDSIGIDFDKRNLDLAIERCGMFLNGWDVA